jgi:iron complex transport system ATP-binding protein
VLTPDLLRDVYHVDADVLTHPRTGRPVIAFTDSRRHEDDDPA